LVSSKLSCAKVTLSLLLRSGHTVGALGPLHVDKLALQAQDLGVTVDHGLFAFLDGVNRLPRFCILGDDDGGGGDSGIGIGIGIGICGGSSGLGGIGGKHRLVHHHEIHLFRWDSKVGVAGGVVVLVNVFFVTLNNPGAVVAEPDVVGGLAVVTHELPVSVPVSLLEHVIAGDNAVPDIAVEPDPVEGP
jgi:hypothetical protein